MANRTIDLLPEIFRTSTNRQFFAATLDQLTQEPNLKKTYGYVGRRIGPGVNPADNYVTEPTAARTDYQLEPGVVFFKSDTTKVEDAITYPGMIDAINLLGGDTSRQDRLWESEYYAWDPFCDLDKFTNYSQYYWLPGGPDPVNVSSTAYPLTNDFTVTRTDNAYTFSDIAGNNPIITLVRGGNYTFLVNQVGHNFWIQAAPGINGTMPATPNISSRDVLGVDNNGEDQGTITFNAPLKTAQDFYYNLNSIGTVDLITTSLKFNELNNIYVSEFLASNPTGIDGITNLDGRTIVFTNTTVDAQDGGWQITTQFDPLQEIPTNNGLIGSFDTTLFDQTTYILSESQRYSVWKIQYIYNNDGNPYMQLSSVLDVPNLSKFRVQFGTQWANTQWYKDASGYFQEMPLLTAALDVLWYQDGSNPDIFGQIRLVDEPTNNPIDINEIIGAKNYTSPNGVVFTNGLKVQFRGPTYPTQYQNLEYYVEGVGTGLGLDARVGFVDGEAYFGSFHIYEGQKMTGDSHSTTTFQQYIYDTIEESLLNIGAGAPDGAPLPSASTFGATVGNGIRLLPVKDFVTPETYTKSSTIPYDSTSYDSTPYDAALNAPEVPDYLTINRASRDRNAWSRSNRWFHKDVIQATADYNNQTAMFDNEARGKRPIIEFRADLRLYNFGTQSKTPINIIDFSATDAFSNINGTVGYSVDGYPFINGTRVIFAADADLRVRNQIYEVQFIDPNNSGTLIIDLVPIDNGTALIDQTVVCLSGITQQGLSFWFDGSNWIPGQQKTSVNQAPLFNVYDINGYSLSDRSIYPSSTFNGSKLFGYALGNTQLTDSILGFSLKFLNINNVGDILFENYLYTDTFVYVIDSVSETVNISTGFVRQYIDRVQFSNEIGWQRAASPNRSRQVFRFVYNGTPLVLDVPIDQTSAYPPLQIYIGTQFIEPYDYTVTVSATQTLITITNPDDFNLSPDQSTIIEVQAVSNFVSDVAFYQIPLNLSNNPINENSDSFTLGTIRQHYESLGENLKDIVGPINGANNTRDLGNIIPYGDNIIQNSSPATLTGVFLRERQFEAVSSIEFNSREYQKYKALLLDLATKGDYVNSTPTQVLDSVIAQIALGRTDISPFYWSDMLPSGKNYTSNTYKITPISTNVFDTVYTYDFTSSNFQGLLIYLNGTLLTKGYDYTVGINSPTVTITTELSIGDILVINEYPTTYGSYIPNTPTKLGLYPAYKPEIYLDTSYLEPTNVIRGHDGSITVAFGDYRDNVLLEFETRIFNNLKIQSKIPLQSWEIIPGQWRTTDYTTTEINNILASDFLSWIGWNKLDYSTQNYLASDPFTYNYSKTENKLNRQVFTSGAWRGIYQYLYDTVTPNTTPWEMLGFSQRPTWWEDYYGPAPYTSGNLVLWEDLSVGLVRDPTGYYYLPQYARPDLLSAIPSGSEGELLSPLDVVTGNYNVNSFQSSWTFGDDGPVEYVWRSSSAWPFAVMRLMALTKPAKFFSLFADRDRYVYNDALQQYLWDGRYRLDAKNLAPLYGDGISKASYIDWVVDYNRQLGINSTTNLENTLSNIGVRLCWRLAAYSDKKLLKLYTERSTPNSQNASLLLPDESYSLILYKDQPFEQIVYSSVVIQITETGYQVYGYNTTRPYFNILSSIPNGNFTTITAGSQTVRINLEHSTDVTQVPYGYTFTNATAVCDFLLSYGTLLKTQGLIFENQENGYVLDWRQMAEEFLYWSTQGWSPGALINLNPGANRISVTRPQAVVDDLSILRPENLILNQNRLPLPISDLVIERLDNTFTATSQSSNTINYLNLSFTAFEHMVVLDNKTIFADLIYDPITGARQNRIIASGWLTGDWNGTINTPGFVLNQDNIQEWIPNVQYTKGQIILFKGQYWSALDIIQPSAEFNYSQWVKSDYDMIQTGLLPNAANDSNQLSQSYSVYNANLENEVDLFSFGLIGFRPRKYMSSLNLDDISQVNLYQQFLGTKGTTRSAEIFSFANLGKEIAQYDIYEYWAILRNQYGATANRNYVELLLNRARLTSDPCTVQVIQPDQSSSADQTVQLGQVWKSTTALKSTNIFPTVIQPVTEFVLPTAGYANFEDVDFTVFDLKDFASSKSTLDQDLNTLGLGSTIWAAKTNPHDWGVFRVESTPGRIVQVSDNLNGRALVTFNLPHGLSINDYLIIRYFDPVIDGTYQVLATPSIYSVIVLYSFVGNQTVITGNGLGFTLQSSRVTQASDIVSLPYANLIAPGSRVWVDDNGFGFWEVLEKINPFVVDDEITPTESVTNSRYGASISQGFQNLAAMVGAPGVTPSGAVYTYVKLDTGKYGENIVITLDTLGAAGFGNAVEMGDQTWALVGANESNSNIGYAVVIYNPPTANAFLQWQLLHPGAAVSDPYEFGTSVTVSQDERWMYVGAPGGNRVYVYGRVEQQTQLVRYIGDGVTTNFNYSNSISIDDATQMTVGVGDTVMVLGTDYIVTPNDVIFIIAPESGISITFTRNQQLTLVGNGTVGPFNLETVVGGTLYSATNIDNFSVSINDVLQRPNIDYTFAVGSPSTITFNFPTISGDKILIRAASYYAPVGEITIPGLSAGARFGESIHTSTNGRQLIVGAPGENVSVTNNSGTTIYTGAGKIYVFDRMVERFQVTDANVKSYTTSIGVTNPVNVSLNGTFLINQDGNIGGQFSISGDTVTILDDISVGDIIEIDVNQFTLIQSMSDVEPFVAAQYGFAVDLCTNDCSLYVGAPLDGSILPEAGHVEYRTNQSRIYGSTTSTIVNPTLTAGDAIRVNHYFVTLSTPVVWSNLISYAINSFVTTGAGDIFQSILAVPAGIDITDQTYWLPISWTSVLKYDINTASTTGHGVPNAVASTTSDLVYIGDSNNRVFSTGTLYSSGDSILVYVNNVLQLSSYDYDNETKTITFVTAPAYGSTIRIIGSKLTVSVLNSAAAAPQNKLTILPGSGTLFDDLGFETFTYNQTIVSPVVQDYAHFGQAVFIATSADTLAVGAPNGSSIDITVFDNGSTYFDSRSTTFSDIVRQSGAVYTYDALNSANPSVDNPRQFAFGQQMYDQNISTLDQFGAAIDYTTGILLVGSPGEDFDSSEKNYGRVAQYRNVNRESAWRPIRLQNAVVDTNLLNTVFLYDQTSNQIKEYLDFFDPLQGRLLGVVTENIDYTGAIDPAAYNVGSLNNYGDVWGESRVGQIWWDTANVRFIDPNQDDIVYASRRWGQTFPGSSIDVYQWVSSTVPPSQYQGPGTVRNITNYSVSSNLNEQGVFRTTYYFWVSGISTVNRAARKTLSIVSLAQYIESPKSSGIPYVAILDSNTVAIYNSLQYISAQDTIIHVEYDLEYNEDPVHAEFHLVPQDRADGFLTTSLYRKLLDSFCGVDSVGHLVPDPFLSPSEQYGIQFRPRQSMFVNRFRALENYLVAANRLMALYPIAEMRNYPLLKSQEPEPSSASGAWNKRLANYEELAYQDLAQVSYGYRYLIVSDSTNNGLWTIYEVIPGPLNGSKEIGLVRVQNYDTNLYWQHINWYSVDFNPLTVLTAQVPVYSSLDTLSVPLGSYVKVTTNGQGKWEIYRSDATGWVRVAVQDGTIAIKQDIWDYTVGRFGFDVEVFDAQYFDQEPVIETRKILQSLNEEIFIEDLAIYRNRLLILMFNYILSEQIAPLWLTKTSLIDVDHTIRELLPYQVYREDNQDFVLNYIKEVKPYHTQIKQFNLIYKGNDVYQGNVTDFDLPAYWDATENLFVSPVLDDNDYLPLSTTSSRPSNWSGWQDWPYNQWFQNYLLNIESVDIVDGGSGYTVAPSVVVSGDCITPAEMTAVINSAGKVISITIDKPGYGYLTTAIITFEGGNGSGARAVVRMGNGMVRDILTTIKYDRYQYYSDIVNWQATVTYPYGTRVRYDDRVWQASQIINAGFFTVGQIYTITSLGTTDFTLIGASSNTVGAEFVATGPGTGNGQAGTANNSIVVDAGGFIGGQTYTISVVGNTDFTLIGAAANIVGIVFSATGPGTGDGKAVTADSGVVFDPDQWTLVDAGTLSGVDRTMGFYVPTANEPGLDLALLISGVDYPGVQVYGLDFNFDTGFDVGNYDITPYDNISYGPEGQPSYDPALLDAIYESEFADPYLGTLPAPAYDGAPPDEADALVVNGGAFVDVYESHAPEELIPGIIYDTLDMRVFTTPGADWTGDGHGFPLKGINYIYASSIADYSFAGLLEYPVEVSVYNRTIGIQYNLGYDFSVDWINQNITFINGVNISEGDVIDVTAYGLGGGNQIYSQNYFGTITDNLNIPIQYFLIEQLVIFVNGVPYTNFVITNYGSLGTQITFNTPLTPTDYVFIAALGSNTTGTYSWSTPQTQHIVADGSTLSFALTNSLQGTNPANIIVEKNGIRARPAEGARYTGDGSTTTYEIPNQGGYSLGLVASNEVYVYVNNVALVNGTQFSLDTWLGGDTRTVTLTTPPTSGAEVLISITHASDYTISGNMLYWNPSSPLLPIADDVISFTTWNDTSQQGILTQVFVGPTLSGLAVYQPYDSTAYDSPNLNPLETLPGVFDSTVGVIVETNTFDIGRVITNASRLLVTLNGFSLFEGEDFNIDGTTITIFGPPIDSAAVVVITSFTQSIIPGAIAFRIFQDMRGLQLTYRITAATSTLLAQDLSSIADTIYVVDASACAGPNLPAGIFGLITIDGERISYRYRDIVTNTLSGLRRGTAGTGAAAHSAGAAVYDIGIGNLLPEEYQDAVIRQNFLADGSTTTFVATDISVGQIDSTELIEAVQVYVGGILQSGGYTILDPGPLTIDFTIAPKSGYQVTLQVRRGLSWYEPGAGQPSNGISLQEQTTIAAEFIKGQ